MERLGFKDAMSLVPTSVSIIRVSSPVTDPQIVAATISSLISLSVIEGEEEIMFALKNNSYLGQKLLDEKFFSINLLNSKQDYLAKKYGSSVKPTGSSKENEEELWIEMNNFIYLQNSVISIFCELTDYSERKNSTLYFGKISASIGSISASPLVYQNRQFRNRSILQ
jgi:flavin reductase (DIM6/NTAB) family NADH-FMN oxidoreductase RutF